MSELVEIIAPDGLSSLGVETIDQALQRGDLHQAVRVVIYTASGKVLMQQRSHTIMFSPDKWDISMGGIVAANETVEQAAVRELAEELAIRVAPEALEKIGIWRYHHHLTANRNKNELFTIFLVRVPDDTVLQLQASEVAGTKYVALHELQQMVSERLDAEHIVPLKVLFLKALAEVEKRIRL